MATVRRESRSVNINTIPTPSRSTWELVETIVNERYYIYSDSGRLVKYTYRISYNATWDYYKTVVVVDNRIVDSYNHLKLADYVDN